MLRLSSLLWATALLAALGGCAAPAVRAPAADAAPAGGNLPRAAPLLALEQPLLRLAPSALPGGLALQQRLTFTTGDRSETVDALVEVDAESVRVLIHMQGQVALRLIWDGETLQQERADWLPPQLRGERVLSDLQLVYWPQEAINAALPTDWSLTDWSLVDGVDHRFLVHEPNARAVIGIRSRPDGTVVMWSMEEGQDYELRIESTPVTP